MKNLWFWISLVAGVFGAYWFLLRRRPVAAGQLGLVAPGPGQALDDVTSFFAELLKPAPPGGLPPVAPPSVKNQVKGLATSAGGVVGAAAATSACIAAGGGPLCTLAAPVGKVGGELAVQGGIYVGGKAVDAGKAVASGVGSAGSAVGHAAASVWRSIF
jgi:hypothetical protein